MRARNWKQWNRERGAAAVDDFLAGRPIRVFDRYGREIATREEIVCTCGHGAVVEVPHGKPRRFKCSKCGARIEPK